MKQLNEIKVYQLKISLINTDIWRRFLVKSDITLPELHQIIQIIMGWTNSHLHHFIVDGHFYCTPDEDDYIETIDYENMKLEEIANKKGIKFNYEYDFGDSWVHEIKVEAVLPFEKEKYYPVCIDGQKACPPEDCGSTPGYMNILEALQNSENPEYQELLEWVGDEYDPDYFNVDEVNEFLKEDNYDCITLFD